MLNELKKNKEKTIVVFGVFDGLDDEHRFFLKKAKECGDYLIAIVAPDHHVGLLKNKSPNISLNERVSRLQNSGLVSEAIEGDKELDTWTTLKKIPFDMIALGYDQNELKNALEKHFGFNSISFVHIPKLLGNEG